MRHICCYFQVHQPLRLRRYTVFEIGNSQQYYDASQNKNIMKRVAKACYLPMNRLLLDMIRRYPDRFKVSFGITGHALEQFATYAPEVLESFKEMASTGNVEFVGETYHHSLASLHSEHDFREQVKQHSDEIERHFGQRPRILRNSEMIFDNEHARMAKGMGFDGALSEGSQRILGNRSPNHVYTTSEAQLPLLLRNYCYSDDIAFRFSDMEWKEWPLSPQRFANWLRNEQGEVLNLFMDYETFGEHQPADTGIFEFMQEFIPRMLEDENCSFITPSQALATHKPRDSLHIERPVSWADSERDLSAWMGNKMQRAALSHLYGLEEAVKQAGDSTLLHLWRMLQCSDHFYYMCTKYFNDGDVHQYFNPYDTPYEAFIALMNIINDLKVRLEGNTAPLAQQETAQGT